MQTGDKFPIIAFDAIPGELYCIIGGDIEDFKNNRYLNGNVFKQGFSDLLTSLQDSGINIIISNAGNAARYWLCHEASKYGCKVIVHDDTFGTSYEHAQHLVKTLSTEFKGVSENDKTSLRGWLVLDEPNYYDWGDAFFQIDKKDGESNEPKWNKLSFAMRNAQELDPHQIRYFNLGVFSKNPDPDDDNAENNYKTEKENIIGSCTSYEQYLNILHRLYDPILWSYDFYPIRLSIAGKGEINKHDSYKATIERPGNVKQIITGIVGYLKKHPYPDPSALIVNYEYFYKYLDIFRIKSSETKTPFWAFCMCCGHGGVSVSKDGRTEKLYKYRPAPRIGEIRFEVFSSLAYGAQGIVYWQFAEPRPHKPIQGGEYDIHILSPLEAELIGEDDKWIVPVPQGTDFDDTKVKSINIIRTEVLQHIKQVNSEIQKYSDVFLGCECDEVYHVGETYADQHLYPGSLEYMGAITATGNGFLVTSIHNGEDNYIVIVNHDPFYEQRIRIVLRKGYRYNILTDEPASEIYTPDTGINTGGPILSRTLDAGGYLIIKWKKDSGTIISPSEPILP